MHEKLVVNFDGGSRGNPGPAAAAAVVRNSQGEVIDEASELLGDVTNNVAEYRAALLGIKRAIELGTKQLHLIGDSELVIKQIRGEYKVKNPELKVLHGSVTEKLNAGGFERGWTAESVPRAKNADADALVNQALDSGVAKSGQVQLELTEEAPAQTPTKTVWTEADFDELAAHGWHGCSIHGIAFLDRSESVYELHERVHDVALDIDYIVERVDHGTNGFFLVPATLVFKRVVRIIADLGTPELFTLGAMFDINGEINREHNVEVDGHTYSYCWSLKGDNFDLQLLSDGGFALHMRSKPIFSDTVDLFKDQRGGISFDCPSTVSDHLV